ncbi:MAG: phosphate signaling complex protein PhoU [Thiohalobacterales bacterium]|nr:phosphate signaling complex protein PhoU [Thiohalobacterales bacterium]
MPHYEERLEKDLNDLREEIAAMAALVETAVRNAMHALQTGNKKMAAATVLGDHPINRAMRKIDAMCHKFIALHLPSGAHLRLLSSVIRANIELERIGDYAVTISREALQLATPPSGSMALELERVGNETQTMLQQAIEAFNELNAEKARATMVLEENMENNLDIIYAELMANDEHEAVKSVLAMFAVFTQLKRVVDQAKNLCEEAVFSATGDTKAPKVYNILFVDEDNSCLSQMAAAIAAKNYPDSGVYTSAGRSPAGSVNPAVVEFLDNHGISLGDSKPAAIDLTPLEVSALHIIVSLQGPVGNYFEHVPFQTTPLEWDVGEAPAGGKADTAQLEEIYREIALQIRDMMETLRGEDAS